MVFENGDMSGMEEGLHLTRRYAPVESVSESGRWLEMDTNEMLRIGERNYLLRRLLTALDGHTRDENTLPKRLKEPPQNGIYQGEGIADESLSKAIDTYYELREWIAMVSRMTNWSR